MNREKQIEIKVVTYKEERLNYFTALYEKAKNKFDRLFKKHKDAPYLSDEFQKMSDAGHEAEFLGDVVKMLKQSEDVTDIYVGNKSEWISVDERLPERKGRYLVYIPNEQLICCMYYDCDASVYGDNGVTHWMPLPEPPRKEDERR